MGYQKAIAALLANLAILAGALGFNADWVTPENVAAASTIISTFFVYLIPNNRRQ